MSGWFLRRVSPISDIRSFASTATPARSLPCARGVFQFSSQVSASWLRRNLGAGRLGFETDLRRGGGRGGGFPGGRHAVAPRRRPCRSQLRLCRRAAESPQSIRDFTVIVTKSTVPVGTGDEVERIIRETNPNADFAVVSNPEFLREGAAIGDFKRPDRIVIGTDDERAKDFMAEVYRPSTSTRRRSCIRRAARPN